MSDVAFGIDFGTTNSLATVIAGDRALSFVDRATNRPHPSVIWYRGSEVVVGRDARENMDLTEGGAPSGFVRSPKMALRREGPIFVDGQPIAVTDAVAEVLAYLKADAASARGRVKGSQISRAVMTIPVDFGGPERRALRDAARKAGISVLQFVHEPVAALYAYFRSQSDLGHELARLEGRSILVFDWGGGTLDLTLCRIQGGSIMQVVNIGDNEVGGDRFDERLRNLLRKKHSFAHSLDDISALEQPGMAAKLLQQCENIKINLSNPDCDNEPVIVRDFLKIEGAARNLVGEVTKLELENESCSIVARGLAKIDEILSQAQLTYQDIELCLATGGMVNMPAIRNGLVERFVGRVPRLTNGDRIIAEGAAWIAHDNLRLTLSKPIEILVSDGSGRGSFIPIVDAGLVLPVENQILHVTNTRLFCTDPREGAAIVEVTKPAKIGRAGQTDLRRPLCVATVQVDSAAQPLIERIECHLKIDHDYVATITLHSTGRGAETITSFHDLDFGLALHPTSKPNSGDESSGLPGADHPTGGSTRGVFFSNLVLRSNIVVEPDDKADRDQMWQSVPGDLVANWRPGFFDTRSQDATDRQREERNFYIPCARCKRFISQIKAEGAIDGCRGACRTVA